MFEKSYRGKKVVVTGAASGIGQATASILTELGAQVTVLDVKKVSVKVERSFEVNLQDRESIDRAVRDIGSGVGALFNCAGLPGPPFSNIDVMTVNFIGLRHLTEALLPQMGAGSSVASIASLAGMGYQRNLKNVLELTGTPDFASARAWCEAHPDIANGYSFAKECIIGYTQLRAKSLGERGIRINCISPGLTETPLLEHVSKTVSREWMEKYLQGFLGRNARPEEQAWPLIFLNSDAASYVSGVNIPVEAGYTAALTTGQAAPPPARQ